MGAKVHRHTACADSHSYLMTPLPMYRADVQFSRARAVIFYSMYGHMYKMAEG
jgi:hypothetical protein